VTFPVVLVGVVVVDVADVLVFVLLLVEDEEPLFGASGAFVLDFVSVGALVVSAGALALALASPDLPGPPLASVVEGDAVDVGLAARRAAGAASMNTSRKTWKTVIPR